MVPNVIKAFFRPEKLRTFIAKYNELMLSDDLFTRLEREMIAVVVSSHNHCVYCIIALSGRARVSDDPCWETFW